LTNHTGSHGGGGDKAPLLDGLPNGGWKGRAFGETGKCLRLTSGLSRFPRKREGSGKRKGHPRYGKHLSGEDLSVGQQP